MPDLLLKSLGPWSSYRKKLLMPQSKSLNNGATNLTLGILTHFLKPTKTSMDFFLLKKFGNTEEKMKLWP
jgi:hypothetical protein